MAKKSKIVREFHLQKKVQKHFELRKELRAIIKNPNIGVIIKNQSGGCFKINSSLKKIDVLQKPW